jgi:predicted ferric reductase
MRLAWAVIRWCDIGRKAVMSRRRFWTQFLLWLGLYAVLALMPLAFAMLAVRQPGRGFWIEFGVGLGFVGLAMLGLQFVVTGRYRFIAAAFGADAKLQFHSQAGIVAYFFILGHVVVLLTAHRPYFEFFDPRVNAPRALALVAVLVLLTLVIVMTLWRKRLGLSYEWWRLTHGVFALLVVLIAVAHAMMVGHYVSVWWKQAIWIAFALGVVALLVDVRLIKPLRARSRPWQVVSVKRETARTWTVEIQPRQHEGIRFKAGQFAWLTFGPSPFSLQQHPFSIASSAERTGTLAFTIKELGDFTNQIGRIQVGSTVFLEGPYGAFTLDDTPTPGHAVVFIVGGIGVTPVMGMLRTLADRGDRRKLLLIYGNSTLEKIAFHDELRELEGRLDLDVVHVLESPPPDWAGEVGYVTDEAMQRAHPQRIGPAEYFVCGPKPMMDAAELIVNQWGIPIRDLNSERFDIV